jgi:hypothetical protein
MTKKKPIPWLEIKAEYLKGCKPDEISKKYDVDIEKLYNKIDNSGWTKERKEFQGKVRNDVAEHISRVTEIALSRLEEILKNSDIKDSDLINAIGKAFDISGLKSSKHEVTGKDGQPIVQQTFLTPAECNNAIEHIKDYIKND